MMWFACYHLLYLDSNGHVVHLDTPLLYQHTHGHSLGWSPADYKHSYKQVRMNNSIPVLYGE